MSRSTETEPRLNQRSNISISLSAVLDMLPLVVAVIPWGVLTGAIAIQIGLTPWQAQAMSLIVFAGAAQLSAMTMLSAGASSFAIAGSVFAISSRHLLYSMKFRAQVSELSLGWRLSIGFLLTDEMFAVSESHTRKHNSFSPLYAVLSGLTFYIGWNITTFIGIILGAQLANLEELGLEFAIVATFIALTFDRLRETPIVAAISVSGLTAVLLKPVFTDSYIVIAGLAGMMAAYSLDTLTRSSMSAHGDDQ